MTRFQLQNSTKIMAKNKLEELRIQEAKEGDKLPAPKKIKSGPAENIEEIIYIMHDDNIKSKVLRRTMARKSLIEFLQAKYE